jgi:membrane-bound lytic murein transglycosylase D
MLIAVLPYFLLSLCLAACARTKPGTDAAPSASVVTGVSRVIIPVAGGQTIRVPRLMGDAVILWSPLNRREQRFSPASFAATASDLSGSEVASWLPSTEHDAARRYLYRLTHEHSALTARVLGRAELYMPIVLEGVRRRGLPPELACLPMVESAFEPQAVSPAGAAGLWQLMPGTARSFGLKVTNTEDERFDVYKSTEAATAYLAYLHARFRSWPLALAAYNCGEGVMQKAMEQTYCATLDGITDYCRRLPADKRPLKEETLSFVPQFTAAVAVMTRAESLGLSSRPLLEGVPANIAERKENAGKLSLSGRYDADARPAPSPPQSMRIP